MYISDIVKNTLPIKNLNSLYVVADFDRTITNGSSQTSWSILSTSDLVPKSYIAERNNLYDYYRPIEIDSTIDLEVKMQAMKEWFQKHIELFIKYQLTEDIFNEAATNLRVMEFRNGAKEFLSFLHENNIPLIIISAGIGNFIESFLNHYDCYYDNIYISSNKILFKNGIASGIHKNIIHSLNKNEVSLPTSITEKLKNRNQVILLGDQVSDLKMVDKNAHNSVLTIGFLANDSQNQLEFLKENFDIVCDINNDYYDVKKLIFDY